MEKITYQNVIERLIAEFPEYKSSEKYYNEASNDLPYIVLGNLCLMAFENIDETNDKGLAEKLVRFTDKVFNDTNSDEKLINLFAIEVLENLTASRTGAVLAKNLFHDKSKDLLEQTLKNYNTPQFLEEYRKV